jgi:hypothetical protein
MILYVLNSNKVIKNTPTLGVKNVDLVRLSDGRINEKVPELISKSFGGVLFW